MTHHEQNTGATLGLVMAVGSFFAELTVSHATWFTGACAGVGVLLSAWCGIPRVFESYFYQRRLLRKLRRARRLGRLRRAPVAA